MNFTLTGHIVSKKNSKRAFMRNGRQFVLPSLAYADWEKDALRQLTIQKVRPVQSPVSLKMNLWARDNRTSDLENKVSSIQDLLVKAGIIPDDDWKTLPEVSAIYMGLDKKNPRAEVELISLSPTGMGEEGVAG